MRDPLVESASKRLEAIFSRAQQLTQEWFRGVERDPKSFRITVLSVMKMLVSIMEIESAVPSPSIPSIDVEGLPWRTFREKKPCKPGDAGWILADTNGAEPLKELLKREGGKVELPPYEFKLSGNQEQFIQRRKIKG